MRSRPSTPLMRQGATPTLRPPRGATFVAATMWATLGLASFSVWLCWGLAGRHGANGSLAVALVLAAGVLPGLGVWTVRRVEHHGPGR